MLLPTRAQTAETKHKVAEAAQRLRGILAIDFVPPDYFAEYPKACLGGWGSAGMNVTPEGKVLPCHAAETIPHLQFETVAERPLAEIWYKSAAFHAYRGTDWLPDPCKSCERKEINFGGCRCQALALAGMQVQRIRYVPTLRGGRRLMRCWRRPRLRSKARSPIA
ncbi:SPASM domain-containing protein [Epibacterium ulvae]|uniref:SPASM domain-containing protein n=1 Tax=Epibacterium ulvae TaxID=1156985 RepID=UPI003EB75B38